ncbi:thioredoxin [Hoeflea sp. WL0058]|uniref:Thioredoxin n=1 Tax=Flavimaribacter sediminis TaxID=2865987 RepID=A0AAE2ZS03_9HYPH|nr:thioredoxin [Flavimaribacter sediminis]MBW8638477.1 thioredoxin [Flavimaribacter sediminis]
MQNGDNPYGGSMGGQMSGTVNFDAGGAVQQAPAGGGALIKDTTTAAFRDDVIGESETQPVLVDFWAPWCGPCKQLGPIIEKVVQSFGGAVKLVKMNIDEHPAIPGQMGIQSIPAVVAFAGGKPVDAFMGAVPESQIRQFIEKQIQEHGGGGGPDLDAILEQGRAAMEAGDVNAAAQVFSAVLQQEPENAKALAGMMECLIAADQKDRAKAMLEDLTDEQKETPEIAAIVARFKLEEEVANLGDPTALQARLDADPNDHQARFDMAKILNIQGEREQAADFLLHIMKADRAWEDDGARKQLLTFFEAWGPTDPATLAARRKLSSLMFS